MGDTNEYGPRLMAYIDERLALMGASPTAFAVQRAGLSASQFGRWRSGERLPRIDAIVEVARALERPVLEVLAHTVGAVEQLAEAPPADPVTIEQAVMRSDLSEENRAMLLDIIESFRRHQQGEPEVVATSKKRRLNR